MLRKTPHPLLATVFAAALTACGGGGSGSDAPAAPPATAFTPVQPASQQVTTSPAMAWTQPDGLAGQSWHWTAANLSGSVLVGTAIPGGVFVSRDAGRSWQAQAGLPDGAIWISAAASDDGQVLVAVALNGGLYRSLDAGANWSRIDAAHNPAGSLDYESVALSADGTRIVAAVMGRGLWSTTEGRLPAPAFRAATTADGTPLSSWWRAVAMDGTGSRVLAASHNGDAWWSQDGGATFAPLLVTVDGTPVEDAWYRVALSRDGSVLALVGNETYGVGVPAGRRSTGLYVGRATPSGWSFRRASSAAGDYTRVAMSADASVVAATLSGPDGRVLLSSDGGGSFAPLAVPAGGTTWRSIALAGDGRRAVLAAGTFFGTAGPLYVGTAPR